MGPQFVSLWHQMTEETVATHVTSGQCPQWPHLTICLLTQFTAAPLQDPLSLVSGHLVSSQLR